MTAHQHYELLCDHDGCIATFNVGEARADVTRREAAKQGWVHGIIRHPPRRSGPKPSLDFCPDHAAELPDDAHRPALPQHARPA